MGRTIPSWRMVLEEELKRWKRFRDALRVDERPIFDDLMDECRRRASETGAAVLLSKTEGMFLLLLFSPHKSLKELRDKIERINRFLNPHGRTEGWILDISPKSVLKLADEFKTQGIVILAKPDVMIRNVVASADLGHRVDLEDAAHILDGTIYAPNPFPGLIYRAKGSKVTMLIFSSGKLVCAGATTEVDAEGAVNKLFKTLA